MNPHDAEQKMKKSPFFFFIFCTFVRTLKHKISIYLKNCKEEIQNRALVSIKNQNEYVPNLLHIDIVIILQVRYVYVDFIYIESNVLFWISSLQFLGLSRNLNSPARRFKFLKFNFIEITLPRHACCMKYTYNIFKIGWVVYQKGI